MCPHFTKRAYFDISRAIKKCRISSLFSIFFIVYKKYANFLIFDILGQIYKLIHEPFKNIFFDETKNISRNLKT